MKRTVTLVFAGLMVFALGLTLTAQKAPTTTAPSTRPAQRVTPRPTPVASHQPTTPLPPDAAAQNAVIRRYCVGCHTERTTSGGLSLAGFDVSKAADHADVAEKMICAPAADQHIAASGDG